MFSITENRKRPRLELITNSNGSSNSNETIQGVASTTTALGTTATLATIGGQSFILSNGSSTALPANILLSICDDNSDESEEYIIESPMLTQIKQENTVATQTNSNQTSPQLPALVSSLPQYRIVNQAGKYLNSTNSLNSPTLVSSTAAVAANNSTLLSNSVQLPAGCEIYVIKEVIDNPKKIIQNETVITNKGLNSNATIKLEPISSLPILRNSVTNTTHSCNTSQNLNNNNNSQITTTTNPTTTLNTSSSVSSASLQDETTKRSLILEAYKKRDDKRRATHNEVERRRRDKINSWIFKLKEMLPTDVTHPNSSIILNKEALTAAATVANNQNTSTTQQLQQQRLLVQQQATTTRTPPSDSKSQILIKACEYIKSMQEEIKSLRECLTENENLRLCNQRLQDEINTLRSEQQQKQQLNNNIIITTTSNNNSNSNNNNNHNNNNSNNNNNINNDDCEITLNTLNTTYANVQLFASTTQQQQQNNNHHQQHHHLAGLMGLTTNSNNTSSAITTPATVNVTYAKRELIITDYVD